MNTDKMMISPPNSTTEEKWVKDLWQSQWGGETMISRGHVYRLTDLDCLVVRVRRELVGAAAYRVHSDGCELMSINATKSGQGVGTKLLSAVENAARLAGNRRIWLITSNDNLDAMRFYQKCGYRMTMIYVGAIDEARRIKATIPLVGDYGIEIHDEVELVKDL